MPFKEFLLDKIIIKAIFYSFMRTPFLHSLKLKGIYYVLNEGNQKFKKFWDHKGLLTPVPTISLDFSNVDFSKSTNMTKSIDFNDCNIRFDCTVSVSIYYKSIQLL